MTHAELTQLVAALEQRQWPPLNDDQIVVLLSWLAHSGRNPDVRQLEHAVGPAGSDDDILDAALSMLDVLLFDAESLHARQAGLGPEISRDGRRRRYRLLLSAFHPDRYPGRAEWLTARSQIITRSYARFKVDPDEAPDDFGLTVAAAAPPGVARKFNRRAPAYRGIAPESPKGETFREWLARDRFLAHKVIGGLSLLLVLPVISVLLDRPVRLGTDDFLASDSGASAEERIPSPFLDWPLPEVERVDWTVNDPLPVLPVNAAPPEALSPEWPPLPETEALAWLQAASLPEPDDGSVAGSPAAASATSPSEGALQQDLIAAPIRLVEDTASRIAEVMAHLPDPDNTRVINALPRMTKRRPEEKPDPDPASVVAERPIEAPAEPAAESAAVAVRTEPEALVPEVDEEPVDPRELLESRLALGPLANHPAGRLLNSYHESIERGDLEGLLDMLAPSALAGNGQDQPGFEQAYRELFASSRRRALSLRVLHARRQDSGWLVRTEYKLEMVRSDSGDVERVRREVEYSMTEDDGRLRIAGIEPLNR